MEFIKSSTLLNLTSIFLIKLGNFSSFFLVIGLLVIFHRTASRVH